MPTKKPLKNVIIGVVDCKAKTSHGTVKVGPKKGEKWSFISSNLQITNDTGGTTDLPTGRYRVRLNSSFFDYETGTRCRGTLVDTKDIETARKEGVTGYDAEHFRKTYPKNPQMALEVEQAAKAFNPALVYFCGSDFQPEQL